MYHPLMNVTEVCCVWQQYTY